MLAELKSRRPRQAVGRPADAGPAAVVHGQQPADPHPRPADDAARAPAVRPGRRVAMDDRAGADRGADLRDRPQPGQAGVAGRSDAGRACRARAGCWSRRTPSGRPRSERMPMSAPRCVRRIAQGADGVITDNPGQGTSLNAAMPRMPRCRILGLRQAPAFRHVGIVGDGRGRRRRLSHEDVVAAFAGAAERDRFVAGGKERLELRARLHAPRQGQVRRLLQHGRESGRHRARG